MDGSDIRVSPGGPSWTSKARFGHFLVRLTVASSSAVMPSAPTGLLEGGLGVVGLRQFPYSSVLGVLRIRPAQDALGRFHWDRRFVVGSFVWKDAGADRRNRRRTSITRMAIRPPQGTISARARMSGTTFNGSASFPVTIAAQAFSAATRSGQRADLW